MWLWSTIVLLYPCYLMSLFIILQYNVGPLEIWVGLVDYHCYKLSSIELEHSSISTHSMIFIPVSDCSRSWCVTLVFSCIILVFHPLFNTDQSGISLSWSAWVAAPTPWVWQGKIDEFRRLYTRCRNRFDCHMMSSQRFYQSTTQKCGATPWMWQGIIGEFGSS